jgi:hypothetical protein
LQIRKDVVRLRLMDSGHRCSACQTWRPYRLSVCATPRCSAGAPAPARIDPDNYYVRLYRGSAPQRLRVREHSAQIDAATRAVLETDFKKGRLEALVCTPTLELGVDIGPLLTVVLRRAPPTPANYAQRVGRAGRRLRIGFVSTFCVGSPHDRHVFEDPAWLVAGRFDPPRIRLENQRIAHRHLRSYLLSSLAAELPQLMGKLLDDLVAPTTWRPELLQPLLDEVRRRRDELVARLAHIFDPDRVVGRAAAFDGAEIASVVDGFEKVLTDAIGGWWERVRQLDREYHEFSQIGSPRLDKKKAEARSRAFRELTTDPERAYALNYLSTRDVLPAYQFPLDAFTLDPGVTDTPLLHRPAALAIEEFAPGNFVYANGHKLRSIRVLFAGGPGGQAPGGGGPDASRSGRLRQFHFCAVCDQAIEGLANACPRCGSPLGPAVETLFVEAFEAEESLRIGSDEESRQRQYQDRRDHLLIPPDCTAKIYGYPLAPVEVLSRARLLVTNWGRKPWRGKEGERFWICPECGRHIAVSPVAAKQSKSAAKRHEEESARHARFCSGQYSELVLGYEYTADALVLGLPARGDCEPEAPASASRTLVTLTEALLAGATTLLELEPGELGAFPRRAPPGRAGDEIVVYENVPGGAGYVDEIARRLPDVAASAMARLYGHECARACYLCLKHYRNQGWHARLDKHDIVDVLRVLSTMEPLTSAAARPGAAVEILDQMLTERHSEQASPGYRKGEIEELLQAELARIGDVPPGVRDLEVRDETGRLITVPDFAWPAVRLAVYCDGYAYHGNVETLALDARKRNWLQARGWTVLTFWGRTLRKTAGACAHDVADAYRRRMSTVSA